MAYQSDDPRPTRKVLTAKVEARQAAGSPDVPQVPAPVYENGATRRDDDDLRPSRPSEDDMRRVLKDRERKQQTVDRTEALRKQEVGRDEVVEDLFSEALPERTPQGRTVKKLVAYSCALLAGLWTLSLFTSMVRDVLVAQTRGELFLALMMLATSVIVVLFIVSYAWSLFAWLPKIDSVMEKDYQTNLLNLMKNIRDDYLARLPPTEEYAAKLRVSAAGDLVQKLKTLRTHEYSDSRTFLGDFRSFQTLQDKQAAKIIKRYSLVIAVKAAASPWRVVDVLAVFFNSTLMICDLANVYNRRMSRAHAFRLSVRWAFNLYVSGEIGQATETSADALNSGLGNMLGESGLAASIQPFLPLFSKFVGKAAEGGVNAYFAYRLGKRAVSDFRYMK